MSDVVEIEDYKPHACFDSGKAVVVIPLSALQDVVDGKLKFADIESSEDIAIALLKDFIKGQRKGLA